MTTRAFISIRKTSLICGSESVTNYVISTDDLEWVMRQLFQDAAWLSENDLFKILEGMGGKHVPLGMVEEVADEYADASGLLEINQGGDVDVGFFTQVKTTIRDHKGRITNVNEANYEN